MGDDRANASVDRLIAPDGLIEVALDWVEWSNTHWVGSPRVMEIATGRVLLDLWGTDWDADVSFPRERAVRLGFRRYHVGGSLDAEIDLGQSRYTIEERPGENSHGPLADMPSALEAASRRAAAAVPPRLTITPVRASPRSYAVALLILIGALIAIAGATFLVEHFRPPPVQKLDRIPPVPPRFEH